jgi:hypothetical protein
MTCECLLGPLGFSFSPNDGCGGPELIA